MRLRRLLPFAALLAICGATALAQVLPTSHDASPASNEPQEQQAPAAQAMSTTAAALQSAAPSEGEERALSWAARDGRAQRDAYEKIAKKQKERSELIEATRVAFLYAFIAREQRGERMLEKYRLVPNPAYHSNSRATAIFAKVRGCVWIDEDAAQLARAEIEVTEDISIGGFLVKIYKGSHLMQERYEMAPGLWFATYTQYDFDGRRLFLSFGIHERTFYSQYRRIGPPKEALQAIRAELGKTDSAHADP